MDRIGNRDCTEIDTAQFSIQPLRTAVNFAPDRPKTNPRLRVRGQYEARMDVEGLVGET